MYGVSVADFEQAYWPARDAYDRGQSDVDYWRAVGEPLGVDVSASMAESLTAADVAGWLHTDPSTLSLLESLDSAGVPMALLSNAPVSFARVAEEQEWTKHFRHLVFSGDLGCAKPDRRIWDHLVSLLDAAPGDVVFLDDRQTNVDGALAAGIDARLWAPHVGPELGAEFRQLGA
ncbi:HAD-IA family hydrolase [Lentzea tibetensis]|uniref:HAD-IA family hydrolase n=2 Tax=Lentzea tibetensis TaxID=2591470 RepID=A0A563EZW3_9PSEU|nr:HAD-IA family hydrolase [Lentzea tibetensis]